MENYLRKNYPKKYANNKTEYNTLYWNTTFDVPNKKYMNNANNLKLYHKHYSKGFLYWFFVGFFNELKLRIYDFFNYILIFVNIKIINSVFKFIQCIKEKLKS